MNAVIYRPDASPEQVDTRGLAPLHATAQAAGRVAELLGCAPQLVDVLASGPDYVAYSIFDCEDQVNLSAMQAVSQLTGVAFDIGDDDTVLCGAVLVVRDN